MNQSVSDAQPARAGLAALFIPALAVGVLIALVTLGTTSAWWRHEQWGTALAAAEQNLALVVPAAVIACSLGLAFIFTRARLLALASRSHACPTLSTRESIRVFVEGTVVECLAWPGKAWADAYRTTALRAVSQTGATWQHAAKNIVRFRAATIVGAAGVLLLASFAGEAWHAGLSMIAAGVLLLAFASQASKTRTNTIASVDQVIASRGRVSLARLSSWALLGTLLSTASAVLVANVIAGVSPWAFAPLFVLVTIVSSVSTLPMGLGFAEVGGWLVLTRMLGVDAATAALTVATYRLAGPGLTLLLGVASFALRAARGATTLHALRAQAINELQQRTEDSSSEHHAHERAQSLVESKEAPAELSPTLHFTPPPMQKVTTSTLAEVKPEEPARTDLP